MNTHDEFRSSVSTTAMEQGSCPTSDADGQRLERSGESRNGAALVRLALVDPHELDRRGIECLVERSHSYRVVLDTADTSNGRAKLRESRPDIVLLDGQADGLDVTAYVRSVRAALPDVRFLVLVEGIGAAELRDWLHGGIDGVLLRSCTVEELEQALDAVAGGSRFVAHELATLLQGDRCQGDKDFVLARLTGREQEVLGLIADGLTAKAIARKLGLSSKTIDSHRQNMTRKLEASSLADLVKYAIAAELSPPSPREVECTSPAGRIPSDGRPHEAEALPVGARLSNGHL